MRKSIIEMVVGKVVKSLEWVDDGEDKYWAMTFVDGSEISFRFMAELKN
jgi:hypothetical protein